MVRTCVHIQWFVVFFPVGSEVLLSQVQGDVQEINGRLSRDDSDAQVEGGEECV